MGTAASRRAAHAALSAQDSTAPSALDDLEDHRDAETRVRRGEHNLLERASDDVLSLLVRRGCEGAGRGGGMSDGRGAMDARTRAGWDWTRARERRRRTQGNRARDDGTHSGCRTRVGG